MMNNVECYDSFEELFGKKKGKIKEKIKKLGDKIKDGAKGAAMLPILAPLAALAGVMKKQIEKRGKKPVKGLKNLAEQFFDIVVRKDKSNFVDPASAMAITAIVQQILQFFKEKNDRKKAGEKLAPEDEELLNDSDKALKNFDPDKFQDDDVTTEETTRTTKSTSSENGGGNKQMIYIIAAAAAIFLIMRKK
jgi:hypothetical protein